jgi:molybdopterin converting factor small subunit
MIRVLFFGQAKAITAHSEILLPCSDAPDVDSLWSCLIAGYPALAGLRKNSRVARNGRFTCDMESFSDGDEIAIIPPVSGG